MSLEEVRKKIDSIDQQLLRLLNEIVAIEKNCQAKPLSESDEARLQRATTELERVIAELDRGAAA